MRMLAVFEKSVRLRHIGHLDIQRAMQRALRRSGLPVAYSQGFNPHILVTFASALSVGAVGKREIMDVTMAEEVTATHFMEEMNAALPPEMQLSEARPLDDRHPALMSMVRAASYAIDILDEENADKLVQAIPGFLRQETIVTARKTKSGVKPCDVKPLIYSLTACGHQLNATLALTESESCKPGMLMTALSDFAGCPAPRVLVTRTALLGETAPAQLAPLETL